MLRIPLTNYFTDPVLKAPTIAGMLMCLAAAIVGVIIYLRRQSLIGEALSHAAYPGVIIGVIVAANILGDNADAETLLPLLIMGGGAVTACLGFLCITALERFQKVRGDTALCFVLSGFFGIGIALASQVQFAYSYYYQQVQVYLYGQAATMRDIHVIVYGALALFVVIIVIAFYKEIQIMTFDRSYAQTVGIRSRLLDFIIFVLIVLAVVIGIRSIGVVLMSAMLIAPPVAARQYTDKLSLFFLLSAILGLLCGFAGNVVSVEAGYLLSDEKAVSLPTGPMIVLVASSLCLFSLFFSPKRGLLLRMVRLTFFRYRCLSENILKSMWRINPEGNIAFKELIKWLAVPSPYLKFVLWRLTKGGWVSREGSDQYTLTSDGRQKGAHIVRLHRLWELYLTKCMGMGVEKVHVNAEEMEHVLTPEIERELTLILDDPAQDPHHQPIPPKEL